MILHIDSEDKKIIIKALNVLIGEYNAIANATSSTALSDEFRQDITRMIATLHHVADAAEKETDEELRQSVLSLIRQDLVIPAIKHVRSQRGLSLKDARDYVDNLRDA